MKTPTAVAYDVLVCGGGTAGTIAAIQAGRAGARTLLVEKNGTLGGTMTVGGVCFPGLFYAWGRQVIAGIGWELVTRCLAETGREPDRSSDFAKKHGLYHVAVDRAVMAALLDEAVVGAGVELLLHVMVARVRRGRDCWRVTLCTKSGLQEVTTRVLVDCTGDADVTALAGYERRIQAECQPCTQVCHVSGYDLAQLDQAALAQAAQAAVQAGRLTISDTGWNTAAPDPIRWLRAAGENANHIPGINAVDSAGRTRVELAGRQAFLRVYRFLRQQPGLGRLRVDYLAPECGVRETATIVGETTITVDDYTSGRRWPDAVCYAFYHVDLHVASGTGIQGRPLAEGVVPTIPRGALLPAGSRNLLVAGRCLSSDRLANSALRVEAPCMAAGQAVGALAALAVQGHTTVAQVPLAKLYALLRQHGAIVPEEVAG